MTFYELSRTRRLAAATSIATALLLSACGSTATSDTSSADTGDQTVASLPEVPVDSSADEPTSDTAESFDDSPEAADEDLSPEEAELRFEQCLEDAGIDNPFDSAQGESITGDADEDENSVMAFELGEDVDFEAFEKCNEILSDAFGEFTPSPEQEALMKDAELEFNQCMTDNGFDISGSDGAFEISGDIDFAEFDAAASECDSAFDALNNAFEEDGDDS